MSGSGGLDRRSPMPLWAQLEAELRSRLGNGEFAERFPTDRELCEEYGVSRHTVREALRHLHSDGLVLRERGRGSRVPEDAPRFDQPLGTLYSLFRSIEDQGVPQTSTVLELELTQDASAARALGLAEGVDLVHLARVRFAGDVPLALDRAWLPASIAAPLLEVDFTHTALYDELVRVCHVTVDSGHERIRAAVPTAAERSSLRLGRKAAVFSVDRIGFAEGRAIERRHTVVNGDMYGLSVDWTAHRLQAITLSAEPAVPDQDSSPGPWDAA